MLGMLAIVPMTVLLTISFFVLFALKKVEDKPLKTFGLVVAVLLWVSAALVFTTGMFATAGCGSWGRMPCGPMGMMQMKHHMMSGPGAAEPQTFVEESEPAAAPGSVRK